MLLEASPKGTYDCMCDTIEKRRPTISSNESAEPTPLLPLPPAAAITPSAGEENLHVLPLLLLGALALLLSPHPRTCRSAKGEGEAAATAWLWLLL